MLTFSLAVVLSLFLFILQVAANEVYPQLVVRKKKYPVVYRTKNKCYDENHQQIPCPKDPKAAKIAGIVVGSIVGALLLAALVYWLVRRRRNQRLSKSLSGDKDAGAPLNQKKGYKQLEDHDTP